MFVNPKFFWISQNNRELGIWEEQGHLLWFSEKNAPLSNLFIKFFQFLSANISLNMDRLTFDMINQNCFEMSGNNWTINQIYLFNVGLIFKWLYLSQWDCTVCHQLKNIHLILIILKREATKMGINLLYQIKANINILGQPNFFFATSTNLWWICELRLEPYIPVLHSLVRWHHLTLRYQITKTEVQKEHICKNKAVLSRLFSYILDVTIPHPL